MSFEQFLQEQAKEGAFDSEGAFTLNFEEAAERLAAFRLPSAQHYLLKVVQVASRLGAASMKIRLERFRTAIFFRAERGGAVTDFEAITRAFLAPLEVDDPVLADLAAALWGAQSETTQEVLWSFSQGYRGRRVFIKDRVFRTEEFTLEIPIPEGEPPCVFHLSVIHTKSWRFWVHSRRNAEALLLLTKSCVFSRVHLVVDGRAVEKADGSYLTDHRKFAGYSMSAAPYDNVLYELAEDGGFETGRPGLAQYVVRDRHFNVWASGTRISNRTAPDGISSPTWMVQFRQKGEDLSMRQVPKHPRCRLILAYDRKEAADKVPLRLTLVRQSILLEHRPSVGWGIGIEKWHGCHLILDDDSLGTDLTGFQVIEDDRLLALLKTLESRLDWSKSYFEQGRRLLPALSTASEPRAQ